MVAVKSGQEPLKALQVVKYALNDKAKDAVKIRGVQQLTGGKVVRRFPINNRWAQ